MDEKRIDSLLKDVKIDRERVRKSIYAILHIYNLKLKDVSISRRKLTSSRIFLSAVEECSLEEAKEILKEKYLHTFPAPITLLEFKGKYVLFMGSNRAVIFVLKGRIPDCIVIKLPNTLKEPVIVSEARQTLKQVIEERR